MGRYRSIQATLIESSLKGLTDNQTITAYKKDCKLFAAYCKEQGVKRPDQLQEAKEEAKAVTEDWMLVLGQREILRKKMDIINFVLKFHDYKCLEMAQNFVRAAYNQQPPEEEEEQEGEE